VEANWKRRRARSGGKKERGVARGGESEAKASAGAGRGAVRAKRGGAGATTRGAPRSRAGERNDGSHGERASRQGGGNVIARCGAATHLESAAGGFTDVEGGGVLWNNREP